MQNIIRECIKNGGDLKELTATLFKIYKNVPQSEIANTISILLTESFNLDQDNLLKEDNALSLVYENLDLVTGRNKIPIPTESNILTILETSNQFKDFVWYDEFHHKYLTKWNPNKNTFDNVQEWSDNHDLNFTTLLQSDLRFHSLKDNVVNKAIRVFGKRNTKNEPKDWLLTLKWDGTPRIENFFVKAMECESNDYNKMASFNFWVSMVARVMRPGCKVDTMPILEGAQGAMKSTALGIIGGSWFSEVHEAMGSKDFYLSIQGKILIEIGELDAFNKIEVNTIKKVISCASDRFRPPYGRLAVDFPRQCIFVGTTNESEYLRDNTGARRFWPIRINRIDTAYIKEFRDQFFAEALECYRQGEKWYEMPVEATRIEQEDRRQVDPWEELILDYAIGKAELTMSDIIENCLKIQNGYTDSRHYKRIGSILRLGGYKKKDKRYGEKTKKVWLKF